MTTHAESFYWGNCVEQLVQTQRLGPWLSSFLGEPGSFSVIADDHALRQRRKLCSFLESFYLALVCGTNCCNAMRYSALGSLNTPRGNQGHFLLLRPR